MDLRGRACERESGDRAAMHGEISRVRVRGEGKAPRGVAVIGGNIPARMFPHPGWEKRAVCSFPTVNFLPRRRRRRHFNERLGE